MQQKMSKTRIQNSGEPLRFSNVEDLIGFSAEPKKGGEQINVLARMALTSDAPIFHRLAESLDGVVNHMAQQANVVANLRKANTSLLIIKPDRTAELWIDTAAVSLKCALKRSVKAGEVVFENDIADITAMGFPCIDFGHNDKVLCLFRQDWRFGLAFDMNPDGNLDIERFNNDLGTLYRQMRYKHLYDALGNEATYARLMATGWFPFAEIINSEFKELFNQFEAHFDMAEIEGNIVAQFDESRMNRILERWLIKLHFGAKIELLKEAITAFNNKQPITVIKILLTEIEGVLDEAYRATHNGLGAKLNELLKFAESSAEQKAGSPYTLLFPKAFGRYLREHTYAHFDPVTKSGAAHSRNAVGHGAAPQDSYTMTRALQAVLTLDQLAFYT